MFLVPLLTLIIIIWILYAITNHPHQYPTNYPNNNNNQTGYSLDHSLEILRERYARGDISTEEYQKIKRNLEN